MSMIDCRSGFRIPADRFSRMLTILAWCLLVGALVSRAQAAVWQWSVPVVAADAKPGDRTLAFLWIPENCARVRGVVFAQNNMIEEGLLEHSAFRRTLSELGFAEVWVAPKFDQVFDFTKGAGERFDAMMRALADASGYTELVSAPIVPMGHSACASFPWNFAAWNPARTLAVLSVKGDAPQTELTGSGKPNPDWGNRSIDGVPGLMVMSEYEWWEARLAPLMRFRVSHPTVPLAVLADVGRSHFDISDALVEFLAHFIRSAAAVRLGAGAATNSNSSPTLYPVDPARGWLADRWRGDEPPRARPAKANDFRGERTEAFWCFDEEMARATEAYYARTRGKRSQQVDFVQEGVLAPIASSHTGVTLKFVPLNDEFSLRVGGDFITPLPPKPPVAAKDRPPPLTEITPTKAVPEAHAGGRVLITRITGPATLEPGGTLRVELNRTASTTDRRSADIWLLAENQGDRDFKSAVQQALLHVPEVKTGTEQRITFPKIADQKRTAPTLKMAAMSDAGLPVSYYVREGPATVEGDRLVLTPIPPRAKFPMHVTVVAWQLGHGSEPVVKAAQPVEQTFAIFR